jgi:hypothetical protein
LLAVARATFQSWVSLLASQFEKAGMANERANNVALIAIASVEGALVLCRAEGTDEPLRVVEGQLRRLLRN